MTHFSILSLLFSGALSLASAALAEPEYGARAAMPNDAKDLPHGMAENRFSKSKNRSPRPPQPGSLPKVSPMKAPQVEPGTTPNAVSRNSTAAEPQKRRPLIGVFR